MAGRNPGAAIEPEPENQRHLQEWIIRNGVTKDVTVVAAAVGASEGPVTFARNSTMGHAVATPGQDTPLGTFSARMTTIDSVLLQHPHLQDRRTFLKIDVEGHEPEVIEGARRLLESRQVDAIVWERGRSYDSEAFRKRLVNMMERLSGLGYSHFRFPHETLGGPLLPYIFNHELLNVCSLAQGFLRRTSYARPVGPFVAPPRPSSVTLPVEERRRWTRKLMAARATDGARWADPANLDSGAEERAQRAAAHIAEASQILDLGAGLMKLKDFAPAGIRYTPADLVLRDPGGIVIDLNSGDFPPGSYDGIVMLELLEYLHDPHAVLTRARSAAPRLLMSYRTHNGGDTGERRAEGIFNDFTREDVLALLEATEWKPAAIEDGPGYTIFLCSAVTASTQPNASEAVERAKPGWAGLLGLGRR